MATMDYCLSANIVGREALRLLANQVGSLTFVINEQWNNGHKISRTLRTRTFSDLSIDQFSDLLKPEINSLADEIKGMGDKFIIGVPEIPQEPDVIAGTATDSLSGLCLRWQTMYDVIHDEFLFQISVLCKAFEWKN